MVGGADGGEVERGAGKHLIHVGDDLDLVLGNLVLRVFIFSIEKLAENFFLSREKQI